MLLDAGVSPRQQTNIQVNKQIKKQTQESKNKKTSNFNYITMTHIYNNNDACQMIVAVNGGALLIVMNTQRTHTHIHLISCISINNHHNAPVQYLVL